MTITLEQARRFYPSDQCPSNRELERLLSAMYAIAHCEWDAMVEERRSPKKGAP